MIRRSRSVALAAVVPVGIGLLSGTAVGANPPGRTGPGASIRNDSGTAYFALVRDTPSTEYAAGILYDKALGTDGITYAITLGQTKTGAVSVTIKHITIYTGKGSLSGTATALVNPSSTTQTITNGKLNLTHGVGSLQGDQLTGTFTGIANLSKNRLQFTYKGQLSS